MTSFSNLEKLENKTLFHEKLNLINKEKFNDLNLHFEFYFHGIPLSIFSKNSTFLNELKEYFPVSWQKKSENSIKIYQQDIQIENKNWDNEASQDCFISDNGEIAIQRDFVARKNNDEYQVLLTPTLNDDGFFNFMRWLLPLYLIKNNQFLFHCSSVVNKNGKANLYLGHSGAGKTTICELSSPRKIINDDMNIIEFKDNGILIKTGGIGGAFNTKSEHLEEIFDLQDIYWLNQSDRNERNILTSSKAYSKLMASFANLNWTSLSEDIIEKLSQASLYLASNLKCYELSFKKESSCWDIIDP